MAIALVERMALRQPVARARPPARKAAPARIKGTVLSLRPGKAASSNAAGSARNNVSRLDATGEHAEETAETRVSVNAAIEYMADMLICCGCTRTAAPMAASAMGRPVLSRRPSA